MKHLLSLLTLVAVASFAVAAEPLNANCPMCSKTANAGIKSTFSKSATLCCNKCKAKFDAAPKQWLNALLSAPSTQCPLSHKSNSGGPTVTYSREVAFCSAECKAKFDASPNTHIKSVR